MGAQNGKTNNAEVCCETSQGLEVHGTVVRHGRDAVAFEVYDPAVVLQTSEVLGKFQVLAGRQVVYAGRAVVAGWVYTGTLAVCEARLDEGGAQMVIEPSTLSGSSLQGAYDRFFQEWQSSYRIAPEFKVVVADVEAFLTGVGHWLSQVELGLATRHNGVPSERELVETMAPRIIATFNSLEERFEELVCAVPPELLGVHEHFVRRHWQKLFLCSPFGRRTYYKPLGYAGDYEMMNMVHRNQPEGGSLFAKFIHFLLVSQWPARSVRNRVVHLKEVILRETIRTACQRRPCRILNVGCGPAMEIQYFFRDTPPGPPQEFTLLVFNRRRFAMPAVGSPRSNADLGTPPGFRRITFRCTNCCATALSRATGGWKIGTTSYTARAFLITCRTKPAAHW